MNTLLRILATAALCLVAMGLSSCVWTRVSTHTLTDAVGKEAYYGNLQADSIEIYRRNGVYYAKHAFYKAPARGALLSYGIFSKNNQWCEIYLSHRPEYVQGMEQVYLYRALEDYEQDELFPNTIYKEPQSGEEYLTQEYFKDAKPVLIVADQEKLSYISKPGKNEELLPAQRGVGNYAMAPITAVLYVADVAMSVGATTASWVVINIPALLFFTIF